jgi:hypothetical protein
LKYSRFLIFLAISLLTILPIIPPSAFSHVVLDPEVTQKILLEIDRDYKESKEGTTNKERSEALYRLGEKVQGVVELMNQDFSSHGQSDLLAQFLIKRLESYQVRIAFSENEQRYAYDLAAFREYLNWAPEGKKISEARFQIITRTFYETLGSNPSKLVKTDVAGLMKAIEEEERFLKNYPQHEKIKEVQFFLAVDYYRLLKNIQDPEKVREYKRLSQEALEKVRTQYPGTVEARAAETLLEGLRETDGNK